MGAGGNPVPRRAPAPDAGRVAGGWPAVEELVEALHLGQPPADRGGSSR